ncbi:MAG: ferredoxin--NADP reductase [Azovibrio sp.]
MNNTDAEKWTNERVLSIRYWTPTLLSFHTTRSPEFKFTPGHYTRLGLDADDGTIIWRPYSMVSAAHEEYLEFFATLIPGGDFSNVLAHLQTGQTIHVDKFALGFLTLDQLAAGRDLWLLASGTGLGPFISILREPAIWKKFERLIVVHSVRRAAELAYQDEICTLANSNPKITYIPIVTREPGATLLATRIPQLLVDGQLVKAVGIPLDVDTSRLMICGNPEMARELRQILSTQGFATNRRGIPGQMAFEKYW